MEFSKALVLIDIEGLEFDFLNKTVLQKMKHSIVLIEIHHWIDEFVLKYKNLLSLLEMFFDINVLQYKARDFCSIEALRVMSDDNRYLLMSEGRPSTMRFLALTPK